MLLNYRGYLCELHFTGGLFYEHLSIENIRGNLPGETFFFFYFFKLRGHIWEYRDVYLTFQRMWGLQARSTFAESAKQLTSYRGVLLLITFNIEKLRGKLVFLYVLPILILQAVGVFCMFVIFNKIYALEPQRRTALWIISSSTSSSVELILKGSRVTPTWRSR